MNPTEYGRRRAEYEQIVFHELRNLLLGPESYARSLEFEHPRIRVEDVRFDTPGERDIAILFRDLDRSECLFGHNVHPVEHAEVLEEKFHESYTLKDSAEMYATIAAINWEEEIYADRYGLPEECSSEGINWI